MSKVFKLILLGTGGPRLTPIPPRGGPSQLVVAGDDMILIDCGPGATLNMVRAGVKPYQPHYLFFTHVHHYDHNADYISFVFENWIWGFEDDAYKPLKVFGPRGTKDFNDRILKTAYGDEVNLRMSYGNYHGPIIDVVELEEGLVCEGEGWSAHSTGVEHGHAALAYKISSGDRSIVVSGDLSELSTLTDFAKDADIFVIDAMHPSAEDIGRTASKARVKTLVLSHIIYGWFGRKLDLQAKVKGIRKYYDGDIVKGRDLMTFVL